MALTIPEVAEHFDVSRSTAWRWVVQEHLFPNAYQKTPGKPGSEWVVPDGDVEAFEEKRKGRDSLASQQNDS